VIVARRWHEPCEKKVGTYHLSKGACGCKEQESVQIQTKTYHESGCTPLEDTMNQHYIDAIISYYIMIDMYVKADKGHSF